MKRDKLVFNVKIIFSGYNVGSDMPHVSLVDNIYLHISRLALDGTNGSSNISLSTFNDFDVISIC